MSMTVNKISISLPVHIAEYLSATVGKRHVSRFITKVLQEKLLRDTSKDPVEDFIAIRNRLPRVSDHAIRAAITKGRI